MADARDSAGRAGLAVRSGRVVALDPESDARWGPWVCSRPNGLVYHHPAWVEVLRRAYGYPSACLGYEDGEGRLRGILPMLATHGIVTGPRLVSLPHTPIAGPLAEHPAIAASLLRRAVGLAHEQRRRLVVKAAGVEPAAGLEGLEAARWDDTYVLELPERPDDLRFGSARNHARIRWATNKAEREGVRVRPAEAESDLVGWYSLYAETMRWHAVPPRPYRFFRAMWQLLAPVGMLRLLVAERQEGGRAKLIAGAVVLRCGQTAAYAFNGRRHDELGLRPNDLLQWTAIHELCADGVRSYDLGEVEAHQAGLADFKAKWGAQPRALSRYHHPPGHRRALPPRTAALARRAAEGVWRRLPLPLTTQVGGWLYGHL